MRLAIESKQIEFLNLNHSIEEILQVTVIRIVWISDQSRHFNVASHLIRLYRLLGR